MSFYNSALDLASRGFHVFPLLSNSKKPAITGFPTEATQDPEQISSWWVDPILELERPYNVGISTSSHSRGFLVVIDVDNKADKKGDEELLKLELEGKELPETYTQYTPTGGRHLVYLTDRALKQGVNKLGNGLDIRAKGGYIVAAGSSLNGGKYTDNGHHVADAPAWLVDELGKAKVKEEKQITVVANQDLAVDRAIHYLQNEAPESIKGHGGDATAYMVAAKVKDFGVDQDTCLDLMLEHWYDGSGWSPEKLQTKIKNAYAYGTEAPGAAAPEADFKVEEKAESAADVEFYLTRMNKTHAVVYSEGSHSILHETIDEKGRPHRVFMSEATFKRKYSTAKVVADKRTVSWADSWLDWQGRREYMGVCFAPEREAKNGYYNLWRGFRCKPTPYADANKDQRRGFDMFVDHVKNNLCGGEEALYRWLMGYWAHLIQRPYERPLTTLVFKGKKGTGKNAAIDRIGNLLGTTHYLVAHDGRYLTSNFNGHMDSCLCLVLDEAFWSGDKSAEGKLKGLTTAPEIMIERKGKEPYMVDNLVRLVVIGNENWLVPASSDERRYAVFQLGEGRMQDREYFSEMRTLLDDKGGNEVLLDFLMRYDFGSVDINKAPDTKALADQKIASLDPLPQWWMDCLNEERILGIEFSDSWPEQVDKEHMRAAFGKYIRSRNISGRTPDAITFGRSLSAMCPSLVANQKRRDGEKLVNVYRIPTLEIARKEFETSMNIKDVF